MLKGRIKFVTLLLVLAWTALAFRLGKIQLVEGRHLEEWAKREQQCRIVLEPERGNIYDRMHRLLASSVDVKSVSAFLPDIENRRVTARRLAEMGLGRYKEIYSLLRSSANFVWIRRCVPEDVASRISRANLPGISVSLDRKRYYPMSELAGNLIGFVGEDRVGLEGVEFEFDSLLGGSPGWAVLQRVSKRAYPFPDCPRKQADRGKDLVLTIDANIQSVCQEELRETVERFSAQSGIAIVVNPRTGEVLAISNYPSYDPNNLGRGTPSSWKNRAITDVFEPGSTFKIVVDAAALEKCLVRIDEMVHSGEKSIKVGRVKIQDVHEHGPLTFKDAVVYSSNVAAVKISETVGKKGVYETARAFGFGNKTGIGLPGEARGTLSSPEDWSAIRFANIALGQGLTVTALQLAYAYATIANDGVLLEPRIVKEVIDENGVSYIEADVRKVRRVLRQEAALELTQVLTGVVEYGTGTAAGLEGIEVAGKTGTAQKTEASGGYARNRVVCSFAGYLPASDPRLVIVVVVDEPKGRHWGSDVAAPVFKNIARRIIEMRPYQSIMYSGLAAM
jgi:cell division protein FtsI (penicillin-binding protein 3)